jgi:beta-phosphoglucomutase-like phosphatase (HAD superfamily)
MAVDSLGYLKDEYIVFEDTLSGIKSAKAAGLTCFAIQSYYPETNKLKKNANRVFENLCEAKMYIIANDIFNI